MVRRINTRKIGDLFSPSLLHNIRFRSNFGLKIRMWDSVA